MRVSIIDNPLSPPLLLPHVTIYWGGDSGLSIYLSLFLSFLYSCLCNLSTFFPYGSLMLTLSLSLVLTLIYLTPSPPFVPRDGVWFQGERVLRTKAAEGNENSRVLEPGRGTSTRNELNYLFSLPFFLLVF